MTEELNNRIWCVYMHKNKINNKVYIGITSKRPEERWGINGYNYRNQIVFYRAINKYGWDNFEHIIISGELTENEAKNKEIELISIYKSNCRKYNNPSFGYNETDGGEGTLGRAVSEETKNKIRTILKEVWKDETRREKARVIAKDRMSDPKNTPMYGRKHTDESKAKNREAHKKENLSDEILQKMRDNHKDFSGDKNPNYGNGDEVIQLTLDGEYIAEYKSAYDAYLITGINYGSIYRCCDNYDNNASAGGFVWEYKKDYEQGVIKNYYNKYTGNNKKVVFQIATNNELVNTYNSLQEAEKKTKINRKNISACCHKRKEFAGGYRWMFKEDWDKLQLTIQNELEDTNEVQII